MKSKRTLAAVAAVAALGVAGLTAQNAMATSAPAARTQHRVVTGTDADGRALFAGIFFHQGELGRKLSRSQDFAVPHEAVEKNNAPGSRQEAARVLETIGKQQPGFFGRFSAEVRSGNPLRVDTGVRSGHEALTRFVKSADPGTSGTDKGTLTVANVILVFPIAVSPVLATANQTPARATVSKNSGLTTQQDDSGRLAGDRQVAALTRLLAS